MATVKSVLSTNDEIRAESARAEVAKAEIRAEAREKEALAKLAVRHKCQTCSV